MYINFKDIKMNRILSSLDEDIAIYVYNKSDSAKLVEQVLVGSMEPKQNGEYTQYVFSNASTGFFCSVNTEDADRMAFVKELDGKLLIKVAPLKVITVKDYNSKAKPFIQA